MQRLIIATNESRRAVEQAQEKRDRLLALAASPSMRPGEPGMPVGSGCSCTAGNSVERLMIAAASASYDLDHALMVHESRCRLLESAATRAVSPKAGKVALLRFGMGMSMEAVAEAVGLSGRQVRRLRSAVETAILN